MKETKDERKVRQDWEETQFVNVLRAAGNLVEPEHPVCADRKWRVDYLINRERQYGHPVALEIQGVGFGHHRFAGIMNGYEKGNAIAANGWRLVQVTRAQVANGEALEALARCGVSVESSNSGRTFFCCECPRAHGLTKDGLCANCGGTLA